MATIFALGLDIKKFAPHLRRLRPKTGRGEIIACSLKKTFSLIDDSYNASPASMLAVLEVFVANKAHGSRVAVIGQMLELGQREKHYHKMIVAKLQAYPIERVFFIGDELLWDCFRELPNVKYFSKITEEVMETIIDSIQDGALVLVKGSHGIGLSRFVEYCKSNAKKKC
jgi:UDP-N-acetylmuramoyl-tripeptide--D-alanyl-D-alanine ligase